MSTADRWFFALNMTLAATAIGAALWGLHLASRPVRVLRMFTAMLSGVYVGGYVWVLETERVAEWSRVFRKISPVAFAAVWIAAPFFATLERKRMIRNAGRIINETKVVPE